MAGLESYASKWGIAGARVGKEELLVNRAGVRSPEGKGCCSLVVDAVRALRGRCVPLPARLALGEAGMPFATCLWRGLREPGVRNPLYKPVVLVPVRVLWTLALAACPLASTSERLLPKPAQLVLGGICSLLPSPRTELQLQNRDNFSLDYLML